MKGPSINPFVRVSVDLTITPYISAPLAFRNVALLTGLDLTPYHPINGLYLEIESVSQLFTLLKDAKPADIVNITTFAEAFFGQINAPEGNKIYLISFAGITEGQAESSIVSALSLARASIQLKGDDFFGVTIDYFDGIPISDTGKGDDILTVLDQMAALAQDSGSLTFIYQSSNSAEILKSTEAGEQNSIYSQIANKNYLHNFWVGNVLFPTGGDSHNAGNPGKNRVDGAILGYMADLTPTTLGTFHLDNKSFSGLQGALVQTEANTLFCYGPNADVSKPSGSLIGVLNNNNNVYIGPYGPYPNSLAFGLLSIPFSEKVSLSDVFIDGYLISFIKSKLTNTLTNSPIAYSPSGDARVKGLLHSAMQLFVQEGAINPYFVIDSNPLQNYSDGLGILGPYTITYSIQAKIHSITISGYQTS